jgi:hypothetical protein
MNTLSIRRSRWVRWIGIAPAALLFVSVAVHGQDKNEKKEPAKAKAPPPARQAPATAPPPAAGARHAPPAGGRGENTPQSGQEAGRGAARGNGQAAGRGSGDAPARGAGQEGARGTGQTPAHGNGGETARGSGQPPAHGNGQEAARGSGQTPARTGQEAARGSGQAPASGTGQAAAPNTGQAAARGRGQGAAPGTTQAAAGSGRSAGTGDGRGTAVPRREAGRDGDRVVRTASGNEIHRRPNGEVRELRTRDMDIHHGPGGVRTVRVVRPDRSVIVVNHAGRGYVERPYMFHNQAYVHRTYYANGVAYPRIYRPYIYRGVPINLYVPRAYYAPAFYDWAYRPWGVPVSYGWGWGGSPWYGYYGGYFTPYPVYASPSFWLTDYFLAATLQAAYAERIAAANTSTQNFAATPLTADVKQAVADEVQRQIALERTERPTSAQAGPDPATSGIEAILSDGRPHVFVVSTALDVTSGGQECPVSEGDVLQFNGPQPAGTTASLVVLASKGLDCRKRSTVTVGIADLQDMQNHMRETIDLGLADLRTKQGKNGLPSLPVGAEAAPVETVLAEGAPPLDQQVAAELRQQAQEADRTEQNALREAPLTGASGQSAAAAPSEIAIGQTLDQVTALLGAPVTIVDAGSKKIYVYRNLKLTFTAGKLTDVQ